MQYIGAFMDDPHYKPLDIVVMIMCFKLTTTQQTSFAVDKLSKPQTNLKSINK